MRAQRQTASPPIAKTTSGPDARSGTDALSSGGQAASETMHHPASTTSNAVRSGTARCITAAARSRDRSTADRPANTDATSRPNGVAITKPVFGFSSSTPGVANACNPRNAAAARNASDTRKTARRGAERAATPVA